MFLTLREPRNVYQSLADPTQPGQKVSKHVKHVKNNENVRKHNVFGECHNVSKRVKKWSRVETCQNVSKSIEKASKRVKTYQKIMHGPMFRVKMCQKIRFLTLFLTLAFVF